MPSLIKIRTGLGPPGAGILTDSEPAIDTTPGAPKLYAGIGGVPTILADPARIAALEALVAQLEARIVVLESTIWGIA